jgi:beta-galactosidase
MLQTHVQKVSWGFLPESSATTVTVEVRVAPPVLDWAVNASITYTLYGEGVDIHVNGDFTGHHPTTVPRLGFAMTLSEDFDQCVWFGRGPNESYKDKKESSRFGVHSRLIEDMSTPYEYPQANGNRTDTIWVELRSQSAGTVLRTTMPFPFNFTVSHNSMKALGAAKHPHELHPVKQSYFYVDYDHHGLGSAGVGPTPWPQHRLLAKAFEFMASFRLVRP